MIGNITEEQEILYVPAIAQRGIIADIQRYIKETTGGIHPTFHLIMVVFISIVQLYPMRHTLCQKVEMVIWG